MPRSLIGTVMALLADDVSMEDGAARAPGRRLYGTGRLTFAESLLAARNILTGYPIETLQQVPRQSPDVAAKAPTAPTFARTSSRRTGSPIPANAPLPVAPGCAASSPERPPWPTAAQPRYVASLELMALRTKSAPTAKTASAFLST